MLLLLLLLGRFARDEADGLLERKFKLTPEMMTKVMRKGVWLCSVHTSDVRFAGTNANVFIQVYGTSGQSDIVPLRNKSDNFERNHVDEFKLELPSMGTLRKLRVWHDNK